MAGKENMALLNYSIKLLASNNVVLVECNNYESEIFSPQIVNGRISFLNIIPNRRCCQISKTNVMKFAKRELQESTNSSTEQNLIKNKVARLSVGECLASSTPLANSKPAGIKQRYTCSSNQLSNFNSRLNSMDSTLPTPEPARRDVQARRILMEKTRIHLPIGITVSKMYRKPTERTPQKVVRLVTSASNVSSAYNSANVSVLNGSFRLPCSPIPSTRSKNKNPTTNVVHSTPNDCIARWQKVLTPVRTYTRKSNKPVVINRLKVEKLRKHKNQTSSKIIPSYLLNPTQGLNASQQIEMKKCKLIIDSKTFISPRTFKKQQSEDYTTKSNFSLHPQSLSFHKPRSYLETMGMSAFDLLTNSNRKCMMTRKLNEQFRKGCINKASSTYIKYKVLSTVPPIQQDEQVLELSRISLETSVKDTDRTKSRIKNFPNRK